MGQVEGLCNRAAYGLEVIGGKNRHGILAPPDLVSIKASRGSGGRQGQGAGRLESVTGGGSGGAVTTGTLPQSER
jgi:hypothetical protein